MPKTRVIWDGTPEDMQRLKMENSGLYLIEVQNYKDGNFVVFGNEPPIEVSPPPISIEARLTAIETRLTALEKKPV